MSYALLSDGKHHTSHEFNERVGWDWRKAVSLVKQYGENHGGFKVESRPITINDKHFKEYWLVKSRSAILEELDTLRAAAPMKSTATQERLI